MRPVVSSAGVWVAVALLVAASPGRAVEESQLILEQFDIAQDGDVVMVPVTVNKKTYLFQVDTGASGSVYDTSLRPLLGEPGEKVIAQAIDKIITLPSYKSPRANLGKLQLPQGTTVVAHDLQQMRQISGYPIFGVLGMDILSKYVVRLDFDKGKILFLSRPGSNAGQAVAMSDREGDRLVRFVKGQLSGHQKPEDFLVDTGFVGYVSGSLGTDVFRSLTIKHKIQREGKGLCLRASGTNADIQGRVESLSLGKLQHGNLLFSSPAAINCLGLQYWSRYTVTFDFPNNVLYLKKGKRFDQPDAGDHSGLHFLRSKGKTVVAFVDEGSPAARSGIRPHDELLRVGPENARTARLFVLRRLLCPEGKKIKIKIKRGQEEREVWLTLAAWWNGKATKTSELSRKQDSKSR